MTIIDQEYADLPTLKGPMRTYLLRPAAPGRYPGIVLYSEIFQVTGPIRRIAAKVAGEGFLVAVPEIFHELEPPGTVLPYDQGGSDRGNAHKYTKELASYDSDARAALDYLKTSPYCSGRLGVLGVCIGGHLALRAALNQDVAASACYYATDLHTHSLGKGRQDDTLARANEIAGEVVLIWGRQDPHIPEEGRSLVYQTLSKAGVRFQWHEFNTAHAFIRDEGPRYDPAAARLCHAMVVELFKRKLINDER